MFVKIKIRANYKLVNTLVKKFGKCFLFSEIKSFLQNIYATSQSF